MKNIFNDVMVCGDCHIKWYNGPSTPHKFTERRLCGICFEYTFDMMFEERIPDGCVWAIGDVEYFGKFPERKDIPLLGAPKGTLRVDE